MSSTPLVSIITPCYNASKTLAFALSSLKAQTYENWECIVVDDGSKDNPEEIIERMGDDRVELTCFPTNRGRGAARQAGLERAGGTYLAMLDADDWLYPEKLETQVSVLEADDRLALVGAGMGIVNLEGELAGIRCSRAGKEGGLPRLGPLKRLSQLAEVAFAPSMIRRSACASIEFDVSSTAAEDLEFLAALLKANQYALLPQVLYAYREYDSISLAKILLSHQKVRQFYRKHTKAFPVSSRSARLKSFAKSYAYRVAFAAKWENKLISARSRPPSIHEIEAHRSAQDRVLATARSIFPDNR